MNNSLSGVLPETWGVLRALRIVDASNNHISGGLPEAWGDRGAMPALTTIGEPRRAVKRSVALNGCHGAGASSTAAAAAKGP